MLPEAKGFLEVLQQAEDALLLILPELWAPAITDVLRILWGDKGSVRCGSKVHGWVPTCPSLNLAPAEAHAVLKTPTPTTTPPQGSWGQTPGSCIREAQSSGPSSPVLTQGPPQQHPSSTHEKWMPATGTFVPASVCQECDPTSSSGSRQQLVRKADCGAQLRPTYRPRSPCEPALQGMTHRSLRTTI